MLAGDYRDDWLGRPGADHHTLMTDHWSAYRFHLDCVIRIVDAANGFSTLQIHRELQCQVTVADRLLITKIYLVDDEIFSPLANHLATVNTIAEQFQVNHGALEAYLLTNTGLQQGAARGI